MRNIVAIISFVLVLICVWYTLQESTPSKISGLDSPKKEFSTLRALEHVKNISKLPHYTGSAASQKVRSYIITELKKLGLAPKIQQGYSIGSGGNLAKPKNIVAKIKGSSKGKALLLLSHYDSNPHSSFGASDAGSGVATILEGVRAFLALKKTPKNDIIICITDGEEVGLNGANLFVDKHPWAKNIGLVLNFEARGSGGPSYMLMETNDKNSKLVEEFIKAKPNYPVTNSLAYSIYKLLPNDTDLTVFRKHGDINGFNFAFIDDHFDYHTANDTWQNLDLSTLEHQGSYLSPLLSHFSKTNLDQLKSDEDFVYFNIPIFKMVKYPFAWRFPLVGIGILLFVLFVIYGVKRGKIKGAHVGTGFLASIISIGLSGLLGFGLWSLVGIIYPGSQDILHGFTYNGYYYIGATILIGIAVFFKVYSIFDTAEEVPGMMVAPIFLWLILSGVSAYFLPGGSYIIIPVLFMLLGLFVSTNQKRPFLLLMFILCVPALFILIPFIPSFPVALGLKILFVTSILTVLLCMLLIPVFGFYSKRSLIGTISFVLAIVCLGFSHFKSDFNEERPKPNSLTYLIHEDTNRAFWTSYDHVLDDWNSEHIDPIKNMVKSIKEPNMESKYFTEYTYVTSTTKNAIPSSEIVSMYDSINGNLRDVHIRITPKRNVDRMDFYLDKSYNFKKMQANGTSPKNATYKNDNTYNKFTKRWDHHLLTYHVSNNEPLELKMQFHKDSIPEIIFYESSYDLLQNKELGVKQRPKTMIPKPFVINDAITIKKTIAIEKIKPMVIDTTNQNKETLTKLTSGI